MEINKDTLYEYLLFNTPFKYNDNITLYPVKVKDILDFQKYKSTITIRKDSIFTEKKIIKMSYLQFIKFSCRNFELADEYKLFYLPYFYDYTISLLQIVCGEDAEIKYNTYDLSFSINGCEITDEIFDDLRRIIILQNDIDFDIDEFMNIETVIAFEKAKEFEAKKNNETSDIEDYIDSIVIALKISEENVRELSIRKFWRYIKRINKHEDYQVCRSASMSGFVTFKEPIQHWMTSIDVIDKYKQYKTDEDELKSKIG